MKTFTVIEYVTIAREFYNIEAGESEDAITQVIQDSEREPDYERTIINGGWEAEEQEESSLSSLEGKEQ